MDSLVEGFIERVKQACKIKKITVAKALTDCELNKDFLNSSRKRNTLPSSRNVLKLAEYLEVSSDWLLTGNNNPMGSEVVVESSAGSNETERIPVIAIGRGGMKVAFDIPPEQYEKVKKLLELAIEDHPKLN